ncbi:hypothetical protein Tco_0386446 [Tanacetum coccineum]
MIGSLVLAVGSHMCTHGLPAWQSVIVTPCAFSESKSNAILSFLISMRIPKAPGRYGFYVDAEDHELGDLNEPPNYKAALSDPKIDKWVKAMNAEMQSMKDNKV